VKIVGIFLDRRACFAIIIYNKDDDIGPAAPVIEPGGLAPDMLRLRPSTIAGDREGSREFSR
jgi:hypothetical protein